MIGSLVAFPHHGDWRLGVVKRDLGRKLLVLGAGGEQFRPMARDISPALGLFPEGTDLNAYIEALYGEATTLTHTMDVASLWAVCAESSQSFGLEELAELALGRRNAASCFALYTILNQPQGFFQEVDGRWMPRSRQQVGEIKDRVERVQRSQSTREMIMDGITHILDHADGREQALKDLVLQEGPRHILERLQAVARVDGHEDLNWAMEIIRALEEKRGVFFRNKGRFKIFELMNLLGIWDVHENLFLEAFGVRAHNEEVLVAAQTIAEAGFCHKGRTDLRSWWTVSIDSTETCDVDDALSLRARDGGWELAVHIADVDTCVQASGVVDSDARKRGVSVYTPEGVFPMIPRVLSESFLSLKRGEDRPAVSLVATFDETYELEEWRFELAVIRVDRRVSYDEVDAALEGGRDADSVRLGILNAIAEQLGAAREAQGAVSIGMPESRIRVRQTDEGLVIERAQTRDSEAHHLVQEYMVLYNHLVATMLENAGVAASYRVQEAPDNLDVSEQLPEGIAREFARLKQMRKADVSFTAGWHAGLGVRGYVQATSPIRRYGDVLMQHQLKAVLGGLEPRNASQMNEVIREVERATYEASLVERQSRRYWSLVALSAERDPIDAVVLDGNTVFLLAYGLRVSVNLRGLGLGATIQMRVEHVDARQDELVLRPSTR